MKLCQACERGSHEHCSAQVRAANAPCPCEHCWGKGGSEAVYNRMDEAYKKQIQSDTPIIIERPEGKK